MHKYKRSILKVVALATLLLFVGTSVLPSIVFGGSANISSEFYMADESTIELTITIPDIQYGIISTEDGVFATVEIPGEGFTADVGEARLPLMRYMVEIPQGAEPEITAISVSWKSTSLQDLGIPAMVVPVQPSVQKIPGGTEDFILDSQYYLINLFLPTEIARVIDVGEIRGRRFALIEISPIQYNPSSGELKTMTFCKIIINLPNSNMIQTYEKIRRYASPAFENLFKVAFANYGFYENNITLKNQEGYLIIVYDEFYDEIQPLATWKTNIGYDTTVTKTSDIPGGPTNENIKDYIETAYNDWPIPPSYVLLVGDVSQIPTFTGTASNSEADLYYVTINHEDYFPDMFIGRFPGSQESHITAMVDKTVYYEKGVFPSNGWIKQAAFMAGNDHCQISEGTHNYVIDNYLDPNEYICNKLYRVTYGATTQDVKDALNEGQSLAIYSGHGSGTSWVDGPPFSQLSVNGLINEGLYPFVCSHTCFTGKFAIDECFGETWLRAVNKAALAFWGSSTSTYWGEDDVLERKTFSAWWDDGLERIGGMTDMGLYYLYRYYGGGGRSKYYFECYNVLGDPSVKIWSDDPNNPPPETPETPAGPSSGVVEVEYTFYTSTTDPEGEQVSYLWEWDDDTSSEWTDFYDSGVTVYANHTWNETGDYNITVKSKDAHNVESNWSDPLMIHIVDVPVLEIGNITGGLFKVCTVIRNTGDVNATGINWSITLDGGFILLGRETFGNILILPTGDEAKISSDLICGFGKTVITATAECAEGSSDTKTRDAFVLLFFIF